jgi:RNA polymerase sigma factor (sigma-70 family)
MRFLVVEPNRSLASFSDSFSAGNHSGPVRPLGAVSVSSGRPVTRGLLTHNAAAVIRATGSHHVSFLRTATTSVLTGRNRGTASDQRPGDAMTTDSRPSAGPAAGRSERLARSLQRAQDGDLSGLDDIVAELNPLLWHVARSQGLLHDDAEDVVQTTWLELVRNLQSVHTPAALTGWLIQATKRESWHTNARRRKHAGVDPVILEAVPADLPDPLDGLRHDVLWRHFTELSEKCRTLLRVVAHGVKPDYATISVSLGMPVGSIGPTRGRCLAKLRELLRADPAWDLE